MKRILLIAFAFALIATSCVKEPPVICEQDPRALFIGDYAMTDSVFFLGSFNEIREYALRIQIDTVKGDTVILENLFDQEFGLDPYAILTNGDFIIPSQQDDLSNFFGSGFIAGDILEYTAEYEDGGYSFRGRGVKN